MRNNRPPFPTDKSSRPPLDATPLLEHFLVRWWLREDLDYRQNVAHVRWREETPEEVARRYVWRGGAGRDGFEALLRRDAWSQLPGAISAYYADTSRSRLTRDDHVATLQKGATLLARRGAGRCLQGKFADDGTVLDECGSYLASDGRRNFCGSHAHLESGRSSLFEGDYAKPIQRALEALRFV